MAARIETGRDQGVLEPLVHHVHAYAVRHDDDELLGLAEITLGRIALCHGELHLAHRWLTAAAAHLEDCDPRYILGVCLAMLARLEAYRGHADAAHDALTHAKTTYPAMQRLTGCTATNTPEHAPGPQPHTAISTTPGTHSSPPPRAATSTP